MVIKESLKVGIKANSKAEKFLGTSLSGNLTVSLKEASLTRDPMVASLTASDPEEESLASSGSRRIEPFSLIKN